MVTAPFVIIFGKINSLLWVEYILKCFDISELNILHVLIILKINISYILKILKNTFQSLIILNKLPSILYLFLF